MPPTKGYFRSYTQEAMEAAVEDVRLHKTPYKTVLMSLAIITLMTTIFYLKSTPKIVLMVILIVIFVNLDFLKYPQISPAPSKGIFCQNDKDEQKKKRRVKEKMPSVVSGQLCQGYFKKKLEKKEELERKKLERAAERQRKKEESDKAKYEKLQQRNKKAAKRVLSYKDTSDSSDSNMEGLLLDSESELTDESGRENMQERILKNPVERKLGEYVAFSYEGELFPGVITAISEVAATISAMQKCGKLWKWTQKLDKLEYDWEVVLFHINEPVKMSTTRKIYSVPEIEFLWS